MPVQIKQNRSCPRLLICLQFGVLMSTFNCEKDSMQRMSKLTGKKWPSPIWWGKKITLFEEYLPLQNSINNE